jgi:hypothetical protein
MDHTARRGWVVDVAWLLTCSVLSSLWCLSSAAQLGATFDEPIYLERGLKCWRTGSQRGLLSLGTMPLPVNVQTLPVYLWERARGQPFDLTADLDRILPVARAATLVFWWLLLVYGFLTAKALAGSWGGRLAVALLASEPNLLGHAALATTDVAVTACLLAFFYHFRAGRTPEPDPRWWKRAGLPMLWFAAAVLAKASGLVYGLLAMAVLEIDRLARAGVFRLPAGTGLRARLRDAWAKLRPLRRDTWWIAGGGMVLVFIYCGSDWQPEASFVRWADGLPDGPLREVMLWISQHLCIFSNAGVALVRQVKHNLLGHGPYLLGQTDRRALWYYFPVLLTIKAALPLLLTPLVLLALRPRALANWPCLLAAVLVLFSLTFRVQIGVRFVLPIVVLAAVGLAVALVRAGADALPAWRRRLLAGTAVVGAAWSVSAAVLVWPHGLCHVNELWGGTRGGYVHVSDANYDWGQGLKELRRWQREQGLQTLDVWYFGTDPACRHPSVHLVECCAEKVNGPADVLSQIQGRYLAVSTTLLYGNMLNSPGAARALGYFRTLQPVARTATFLIYDLGEREKRASFQVGDTPQRNHTQ